jgi:uncharacterized RDD family membrane protein YckC
MAKDRNFPEQKPPINDAVIGLAAPQDRLAASILDCVLLLPLVQILQSPVKKWILESFLFNEGANVPLFRLMNLGIFIALFIVYYTLMVAWRGQTIGKTFFSIRVISYTGQIGLFSSFLRAVFIFFEMLGMGIPFLAMFSHPMRRPIHDRVADTLVISEGKPKGLPSRTERWRAQWVGGALSVVFGLSVFLFLVSDSIGRAEHAQAESCAASIQGAGGGLEKVYEMHVLGKISDSCLFEQARDSLWAGENKDLAQFAMAMSLREDRQRSLEYIEALCDANQNSHLCALGRWAFLSDKQQKKDFAKLQIQLEQKQPLQFVRVYIAAILNNQRDYGGALKMLKPIRYPGQLQPVVAALTFHSLLGQIKWDEAFWVAKTHEQVGDPNILYFIQMELKDSQLTTRQQIELLDYFYPSLAEKPSRRPASTKNIPSEIRDIYNLLETQL